MSEDMQVRSGGEESLVAVLPYTAAELGALAAALEAIGLATRAASTLLGPRPVWSWASAMTAGALLTNTTSPFPKPR